jgi:hypothetical protein
MGQWASIPAVQAGPKANFGVFILGLADIGTSMRAFRLRKPAGRLIRSLPDTFHQTAANPKAI